MDVQFSSLRGEVVELPGGVVVVNDCYNANPMSMRAASTTSPAARRAPDRGARDDGRAGRGLERYHREIGAHAAERGVDVLVPVGEARSATPRASTARSHPVATPEEAGALLEEVARPGDRVLVKGSRSVGLERVLA